MTIVDAALEVLEKIIDNGYEAYFVGGFVRDYLLKEEPHDIDITTSALPNEIANIFPVINTGIKYNSVTVNHQGYKFEVTTYRVDLTYDDFRHPTYEVAKSLQEDLCRRDFTINAMAMNKDFVVIDLFGGLEDLKNRVLRTVYEANKRFTEDPLRILRAVYFASKLDFVIEDKTLLAMRKCGHLIQHLSLDRITWELEKIFSSKNMLRGINYLVSTNLVPYLRCYSLGIYLIDKADINLNSLETLALCFYDENKSLNDIHFKTLKQKNINDIIILAKKNANNEYNAIDLYENGLDNVLMANNVNVIHHKAKDKKDHLKKAYEKLPIYSQTDIKITASDLLNEFPNLDAKKISLIMNEVKTQILNKKLENEHFKIINFILKCKF